LRFRGYRIWEFYFAKIVNMTPIQMQAKSLLSSEISFGNHFPKA